MIGWRVDVKSGSKEELLEDHKDYVMHLNLWNNEIMISCLLSSARVAYGCGIRQQRRATGGSRNLHHACIRMCSQKLCNLLLAVQCSYGV